MLKHFFLLACCLLPAWSMAKGPATVYVDRQGVMRWSDTRREALFYGVNYTLPFAHAYRAIQYLGLDHEAAIDRDVYHFARLGFNAYRIHLWDVELTDGEGNLLENEHLRLLDYLIARLRERDIRILITAQTNFGNGYPERNFPTGGFSYRYDKCRIHQDPRAIAAQEKYIAALVDHINPYTRQAYKDDPYIVGFEINNEPCHTGTVAETKAYIDRMLAALRKAGNRKPVFYNVSHNREVVEAYYDTAVQGTTYQWYPIGLVSGYTRHGNFLPYVDTYPIPFDNVKGYTGKARLIYEFDPADVMYSYLYPAVARTFRQAGFQWITQFAYDPLDLAHANTEYQTHYLNLAYTPGKAIGMKIAGEVVRHTRSGQSFGTYPQDTIFQDVRVSYRQDLSELNRPDAFFHTNTTQTRPVAPDRLEAVAGCGSSPVVGYEGSGAYFIDRLEEGVWRLEVMPDVVQTGDPFAKPSLRKEVMALVCGRWDMTLRLPDLGDTFTATGINEGNNRRLEATGGVLPGVQPGVYLLVRKGSQAALKWTKTTRWKHIRLDEYALPALPERTAYTAVGHPAAVAEAGKDLPVEIELIGPAEPDSVVLYTDKISFWNEHNPSVPMKRVHGYTYRGVVSAEAVREGTLRYNVVVYGKTGARTFPGGTDGTPLDWDYIQTKYWETEITAPDRAVTLIEPCHRAEGVETYTLPDNGDLRNIRKDIRDRIAHRKERLAAAEYLCLQLKVKDGSAETLPPTLEAGFITADGYTYKAEATADAGGRIRIPLGTLRQTATALLPQAFPVFLPAYFHPTTALPFEPSAIETLEISTSAHPVEIEKAWLE